jgi:uncharacterized YigZ family protein
MKNNDHFFTIGTEGRAELREKGSLFIGYAYAIQSTDEFKSRLSELKREHPKASHHCFAYRIGADGLLFRSSDDGEPSGTAGRPILGQIDSKALSNVLIVIVRYFGGILLGASGLTRAYKLTASMVLQTVPIVQKFAEETYLIEFDYTQTGEIMQVIKQFKVRILGKEMQLFCSMKIIVEKRLAPEFFQRIERLVHSAGKESS